MKDFETAIRKILHEIGENPDRQGLVDTPKRIEKMYKELTRGYGQSPEELINRALEVEPDNYSFIDTKGWGLHKQGKHSEALEHLKKAWDLMPYYDHECYLHIQEVEQALARQNN